MIALLSHRRLRKAMYEQKFTQAVLAEKADISDRYIRRLCHEDVKVYVTVLHALSEALGVEMASLMIIKEN